MFSNIQYKNIAKLNDALIDEIVKCKHDQKVSSNLAKVFEVLIDHMIKQITKTKYYGFRIELYDDDFKSDLMLQLIRSALYFDPRKSNEPMTYYKMVLRGAICRVMYKKKNLKQIEDDYATICLVPRIEIHPNFNAEPNPWYEI